MSRLLAALRSPDPRYTLGLVRVVIVVWLLIERTSRNQNVLRARAELPDALFTGNLGLTISPLPWPMSNTWIGVMLVVSIVSGILAAVGLFTRPSLAVFTLVSLHIGAVDSAYGFFNHVPTIFLGVLFLLTLLPGSDCLSVDARRRTGRWWGDRPPEWGVSVVLLFLTTVYVGAAVAKIRNGGMAWFNGDLLGYYLHADLYDEAQYFAVDDDGQIVHYLYNSLPTALGRWVRVYPPIVASISCLTVLVELAFPLCLWRRARTPTLLATVAMHIGIAVTISILFLSTIALLVLLIGLPAWVTRRLGQGDLTQHEPNPPR